MEDFGAFFHDGKVGGEVGVEHIVEAEAAEGGRELAGYDGAGLIAEFLAEGDADGGRGLRDNDLVRVAEVVEETVRVVALGQGAGRAHRDALAAVGAVRLGEHAVEGRGDGGVEAAADGAEHAHRLDIVAHAFAAAAEDALVHVAGDGDGLLVLALGLLALVGHLADVEARDEFLELAVVALGAGEAVVRVVGEDELGDGLAGAHDAGGVGLDDHAFRDHGGAGRGQVAAAFDLDDADAAGSRGVLDAGALEVDVTERGNGNPHGSGRIEDGGSFCDAHRAAVDSQVDHIFHRAC